MSGPDNTELDCLKLLYLENEHNKRFKAKRFRLAIITGAALFLLYGFYIVQHLIEEHHAGHHILYFLLLTVFFILWTMKKIGDYRV